MVFKQRALALLIANFLAQSATAANERPTESFQVPNGASTAEFNMRHKDDKVEFVVTFKYNGWFGLLPGASDMVQNADIVAFFGNGL